MRCGLLDGPRTHLPHTTTIPWDRQPGESPCGSYATRNATTGVHAQPESDHYIGVCAGRRAEAEGFEPPGGCPPLAFKVVDPAISGNHPSCTGRSSGRVWSLPGLTNRERMQPQMPPLGSSCRQDLNLRSGLRRPERVQWVDGVCCIGEGQDPGRLRRCVFVLLVCQRQDRAVLDSGFRRM
jgi:hypothetical protein